MKLHLVQEVLACLPKERTLFWYYRDRYAVYLLEKELGRIPQTVSELKRGRFSKLVNKPVCQPVISRAGNRPLCSAEFANLWPTMVTPFVLTVDKWGGSDFHWNQTSTPGWNLVLHMNFSNQHDHHYRCSLGKDFDHFKFFSHPIHAGRRNTLGWARIDLCFDEGVALIEEIQTDWLREAKEAFSDALQAKKSKQGSFRVWGCEVDTNGMLYYYRKVLMPYLKVWSEAMLTATLNFIRDELGFGTIFYHQYETGKALKHIEGSGPPKSLYTDLPKKFCFRTTEKGPQFVVKHKEVKRLWKKLKKPSWFVLEI